ncbi:hypothetical protein EJ04DRAFT_550232 [Polyplosphaeria fusca]|uniref:ELYS-like domain-containing protein n=1 Tax=Polyplosphaeria fusca TaxID=682080 RepID=A0A9P4V4P8_9PLEO|nr:hypothetical protein EJ04DRAFT_550232 [Polyplosphaeria fusca]
MLDIEEFEAVFPEGAEYTQRQLGEIKSHQSALGGKTFFERLLDTLQIKGRKIYPPRNKQQLQELHERIANAPIALHYKHCLFFYLLKDLSPTYHEQTELATAFAAQVHLEKRFWTFIEGLWALDQLQLETAVGNLTHPSIIPTFPDEIMLALLNPRNITPDTTNAEYILPMAYYNCAKPPLTNDEAKIEFVRYMADRNVTETFYWIRGRPEYEHKQLLEILVEETLEHRSRTWTSAQTEEYSSEKRAMEFVTLAMDEDEQKWVESFLTEGKGRNFRTAKDTVLLRKIATGRYDEAADENALKGRRHIQTNWEILKDGVTKGLGPRKDVHATVSV